MLKYIFVTGGVLSSLGKGITAASLGALLEARGFKVRLRKFEPYLNVDPGTMSPYQHGEVFVTEDGAETDLDLGHYERFTSLPTRRSDAISTGQIYAHVIANERRGDYLGATVQVVPHITDAIKNFIQADLEEDLDFLICEIGGTVGDIEGLPFLEAIRQFALDKGRGQTLFIHLTLVPYIKSAGEIKTKPSQHSVKELQSMGIQPDILICRSEESIPEDARQKLAQFCNIKPQCVIEATDQRSIYEVPLALHNQGLDYQVCSYFGVPVVPAPNLEPWVRLQKAILEPKGDVRIAVVGKYTDHKDAYKSLGESLLHAAIGNELKLDLEWIDSEKLQDLNGLQGFDGILVPGGYGDRGIEGKIQAIQFARENKVPFMGICLGMQLTVIEAARNLLGLKTANSTEFGKTDEPVVLMLSDLQDAENMGGTMRLGAYACHLTKASKAHEAYGSDVISERHRHRYEVNSAYQERLEKVGLKFVGICDKGQLPEMVEYEGHPWFVAMQFHPEFKSRPLKPHPIFLAFIKAAYQTRVEAKRRAG